MDKFTKALLNQGKNLDKQNMVWNMVGSFCYAFASMVLAFFVMRIVGDKQGGIFSFGYSTLGQQMFILAYFGMRPFHITDSNHEYSFRDYLYHRYLTCGAAIIAGGIYLLYNMAAGSYTVEKTVVVFLLVLYKVIDGFADVYESEFQRSGRLYLTGKSAAFRTIFTVFCFLGPLLFTKNLLLSCSIAVIAQVAGVFIFDVHILRQLQEVDQISRILHSKKLTQETSLLFLSAFIDFYIFSAAKYAIDSNLNDAASGYFNIIFMPTSVINLVAGFVFRPFLTALTEYWNRRHLKEFKALFFRILFVVVGIGMVSAAGAWILGKPVLKLMEIVLGSGYEESLTRYTSSFVILVTGGAFFAVMSLLYYTLVIMRKQKEIFGIYVAVGAFAYLLSNPVVKAYGIKGAAAVYLLLMILLASGFAMLTQAVYRKEKKDHEE